MKRVLPILKQLWFPALQYLALPVLVLSAIAVVDMKQHGRALQTEYQALSAERERLEVEYNQLRLERGYVGAHSRVGELAEKQLNMKVPEDYVIVQTSAQE